MWAGTMQRITASTCSWFMGVLVLAVLVIYCHKKEGQISESRMVNIEGTFAVHISSESLFKVPHSLSVDDYWVKWNFQFGIFSVNS